MSEETARVPIRLDKIVVLLASAVAFLLIANIAVNLVKLATDTDGFGIVPLFDLKAEQNIPTFFSGCLLILNAGLFAVVWKMLRHSSRRENVWLLFSALFLFLAFDELFQVHEKLVEPIRSTVDTSGLLYFAWVLAYGAGLLLLAAIFGSRWWRLEPGLRWWLAASAVVYVTGAVGFEMIGGAIYEASNGQGGALYALAYTVEETLEMVGLVMLTYTLLGWIADTANVFELLPYRDLTATRSTGVPIESRQRPAWPTHPVARPQAATPHAANGSVTTPPVTTPPVTTPPVPTPPVTTRPVTTPPAPPRSQAPHAAGFGSSPFDRK